MLAEIEVVVERECDGRWIGDVAAIQGAVAYGDSKESAARNAATLAVAVLAERVQHGEFVVIGGKENR